MKKRLEIEYVSCHDHKPIKLVLKKCLGVVELNIKRESGDRRDLTLYKKDVKEIINFLQEFVKEEEKDFY